MYEIEIGLISPILWEKEKRATLSKLNDRVVLEFPGGKAYHWGTEYERLRSSLWRTLTEHVVVAPETTFKLLEVCEVDLNKPGPLEVHRFTYFWLPMRKTDEHRFQLLSRKKKRSWKPAQFVIAYLDPSVDPYLEGEVGVNGWAVFLRTPRRALLKRGPGYPWVVSLD